MSRGGAVFLRWALLCVLTWGVLAMHHVDPEATGQSGGHGVTSSEHVDSAVPTVSATDSGEQEDHGGLNGFLHLCLAVLCTVVGLVLLIRLGRCQSRVRAFSPSRIQVFARPVARPPPVWGRGVLHRVCVLRV